MQYSTLSCDTGPHHLLVRVYTDVSFEVWCRTSGKGFVRALSVQWKLDLEGISSSVSHYSQ
jgi:hypothetical protein